MIRPSVVAALALVLASLACTCSDEEPAPTDDPLLLPGVGGDTDAPPADAPAGQGRKRGKHGKGKAPAEEPAPPEEPGAGTGTGGAPAAAPEGITYLGNDTWEVERKLVDGYEQNPDKLGCSVKEHGQGWEVVGAGPSDDAYALGARNGDVLMEVNGMPLDTTSDLLLVWSKLEGASHLDVKLKRDGNPLTLHYHVVQ